MTEEPPDVRSSLGTPICGAKRKRGGGSCTQPAMPNGRCRFHGGKSTGAKHWQANGRYSKRLAEFRRLLTERADDPAILDVRDKLALLDEAQDQLIQRGLDARDTPDLRREAAALAQQALDLLLAGDQGVVAVVTQLRDVLRRGRRHDEVVLEAARLAERRLQRTVDLRGVMVREQDSVTQAQVAYLFNTLFKLAVDMFGAAQGQRFLERGRELLGANDRPAVTAGGKE